MCNNNKEFPNTKRLGIAAGLVGMLAGMGSAAAGPTIPHGEQGFLTLNYEFQLWAQYRDYRSDAIDGDLHDFFLRRNRVTFTGHYNDFLGFYAQIEAGNDGRDGNENRPTYFRDAYVTFDWSDALRVMAGRFKNTFSRENLEACFEPLTLDRGLISYTPFAGTRDTGVALWGNLANAHVQYRVMVADGRQTDARPASSQRTTARVHVSLLDPEYFYGYRGTYLGTQRVLTLGAAYDYQPDMTYADFGTRNAARDYSAWTVDGFFEYPTGAGTLTLSGAYFSYSVDDALMGVDPDPGLPASSELEGYYLKGGYLLPGRIGPGQLQLFGRHDRAEYDRADDFLDYEIYAAGFNYYLDGQGVKFTFEYAETHFDQQHPTLHSLQDHKQATLGFQMLF